MVYIFGSVLCGASVLSLSCQGQGRVSHWWSLWCSPTIALSSAFFLFFSSVFTSLAPVSTPCTCIALTGNVQSIYWFLMLFACRSIGIHLMFLQDALLLSVCLSPATARLYLTSLSSVYLWSVTINLLCQLSRGASSSCPWSAVVSLCGHYQHITSSPALSAVLDLRLSVFSTSMCAILRSQSVTSHTNPGYVSLRIWRYLLRVWIDLCFDSKVKGQFSNLGIYVVILLFLTVK